MYCYQCQENAGNQGCRFKKGVCGKEDHTADLQDLLIYSLKGLAIRARNVKDEETILKVGRLISVSMFMTITNANFDDKRFLPQIASVLKMRDSLGTLEDNLPDCATFQVTSEAAMREKATKVSILNESDEDIRSLKETITYGMKGICAYGDHAEMLGFEDIAIYRFMIDMLATLVEDHPLDKWVGAVLETGKFSVAVMDLLDRANTETYGHPVITEVNIGVRNNPAILISGHDLKDIEELLIQTEGTGVDVYTHGEMLPAHYYPAFKKYAHFAGNYGNAWWKQNTEFASFNGPIILTTNCITPVQDTYKDRIFTTGSVGYPNVQHIPDRTDGHSKDFSALIELAKTCPPPTEIETGKIIGGFAHNQVIQLADKIVEAVKSGAIKRFVVMAGCDGRHKTRSYFTEVAEQLPEGTIILTAGCAKYRYNKLDLGDIGGIPRVLDAGQCNDSYSLVKIAMALKDAFELDSINDLPLSFDIAWYEQKAVTVLLALLHLGVQNIHLGPTVPAFLSPNVVQVLINNFNIQPTTNPQNDIDLMMAGK
ncbi:MAG: hydroxylamine reductase [Candidatus Cloacimonetes bacterium]|nr:hydroxylamine reductase [Candidatus Cloacimonadota bacterium]